MNKNLISDLSYKLEISEDKTIKLIFEKGFHCVIIPQKNSKNTLCVSSQVGCSMGCKFCLTSKMGFISNLSENEIFIQFEKANDLLKKKDEKITSIVFMGMGEPFLNYSNVISAIKKINKLYGFSYKKITVSSSGIIPKIYEFSDLNEKINLAISFHSADEKIRNKIMPYLKNYPISDLIEAINYYNKKRKTKIMIEYLMIKNLTDKDSDLEKLLKINFEKNTYFNLIPLNGDLELEGDKFTASSIQRCLYFKEKLMEKNFKCFIREPRGSDIEAACGMLNFKD